jgi:hypothetical protein
LRHTREKRRGTGERFAGLKMRPVHVRVFKHFRGQVCYDKSRQFDLRKKGVIEEKKYESNLATCRAAVVANIELKLRMRPR